MKNTRLLLSSMLLSALCFANTITVTSDADAGAGTLRQAILDAQNGDTVLIGTQDTIRITSGQLPVTSSIVITGGSGLPTKVISGENASKLFLFNTSGS